MLWKVTIVAMRNFTFENLNSFPSGKIKEESKKKSKEPKNAQCWTDVELDAYADVLADLENSFVATLD